MSRFTGALIVSPLADGRTWFLRESFGYDVGTEGSGNQVLVPERFLTDFASVPRPLWWIFPPWGRYGNAAVIHDYCYWEKSRSRSEADSIFLEAMEVLEVSAAVRYLLYVAVRVGGAWSWWRIGRQRKTGKLKKVASRAPVKSVEVPSDLV